LSKISQRIAAVLLKISQPILCKILKNRSDIDTSALTNENTDRKRARWWKDSQVESVLKIWFSHVREKNASINGPLVRHKAEELSKTMDKETLIATDEWFNRWKKRENIVYKRMHSAEKSADFLAS
jgi:flagellar motor switch protein FliG